MTEIPGKGEGKKMSLEHDFEEHMQAWGVPEAYRRDVTPRRVPHELKAAYDAARYELNLYDDQDAALNAMISAADTGAMLQWADAIDELEDDAVGVTLEWRASASEALRSLAAFMAGSPPQEDEEAP